MWKTTALIPTGICWYLAVGALALSVAPAEETNKKGKNELVREVDLKGFTRAMTRGVASKPTKIPNAEELGVAFPDSDKEWLDRIAKQVDFEKDELLFFAWTGSGTDRLSFKVEETNKGPVVVFSYKQGLGNDNEAVQIADDQERRVFQVFAVELELLVGGDQVLVLALVFPGEMLAHPDVGPALAALGFAHAAFECVPGAVGVGRGRLGLAEEIAQVKEMLLRGATLR